MAYENMAMYTLTLYGEKARAVDFVKSARAIHSETLKLEPSFVDAETGSAVPEYVVGTLPFGIRWLGFLTGFHGDKKDAMKRLHEVADKGLCRAADDSLIMALLNAWKGNPQTAVSLFSRLCGMYKRNFLLDASLAVSYEEAMGDPAAAIKIYTELLKDLPAKAPGIYPGEIHFRIGKNYVRLKDYDRALDQFQKTLDSKQGNLETEPLVYYNLAMIQEKPGHTRRALEYYKLVADFSGPTKLI